MDVKQVATIVNTATRMVDGEIAIATENLDNIVDVGQSLENAGGLDNYVKALPNVIGRTVFVDRVYSGYSPAGIRKDGWEFGSILAKYRSKMPEAQDNEAWELQDNTSYDMTIFKKPFASAKFFNKATTFEIQLSITEKQVKESFHSAQEMNAFISMLYNEVDKSMTIKTDALVMRTLGNMIAETIYDGVGSTYTNTSIRAVNLLKLFNTQFRSGASDTPLTQAEALYDADFIRYAVLVIGKYREYMKGMSTKFNIGGTEKFTSEEYNNTILLGDFAKACGVYLYDAQGQFNTSNLSLGKFDVVPYWQGTGTDFAFGNLSKIDYKTVDGHTVTLDGVLGCMFDKDAVAVCNTDRYTTTAPYNAKGEFWNTWFKWKCSYFADKDENFVVFYIK